MIKEILCVPTARAEALGPFAVGVAEAFGASLRVAAPAFDVVTPTYVTVEVPIEILDGAREAARREARVRAEAISDRADAAHVFTRTEVVSGSFDACSRELQRRARYADLVVLEQPQPDAHEGEAALVEALLFGSGRPLLIAPYVHKGGPGRDHALVAWDESAGAARALAAAMPLLHRMRAVDVVAVEDPRRPRGVDVEALAKHLEAHSIRAGARRLADVGDVADTLLSHAADVGADLCVMGGYGHSRLREVVLGGATRGMLRAMTLPVLMMH